MSENNYNENLKKALELEVMNIQLKMNNLQLQSRLMQKEFDELSLSLQPKLDQLRILSAPPVAAEEAKPA